MLYACKLCVLTLMVFLAVFTGLVLAFFAWPHGEWGFLNTLMAGNSALMFGAAWYLLGCYRFLKKPKLVEIDSRMEHPLSLLAKQYGGDRNRKVMLHHRNGGPEVQKLWEWTPEQIDALTSRDRDRNGPDADTGKQSSDGIGGHQFGDLD